LYIATGYARTPNTGFLNITVLFDAVLLISLMVLARGGKNYSFGLASCVPLFIRTTGHYFIPPIVIFLYIYLSKHGSDINE
jgi:hypothetical protein